MNSPKVGKVDDGDVGCACHLRGSLQKSVCVENEAGVEVVNDQPAGFAKPSTIGSATVDQSSAFEGASGVDDHGNMQFEGAIGLEDPVDTQFEQPTFEGATGLEDSVYTVRAAHIRGSSGGKSEVEEEDNDIGLEYFSDSKYEQEDVEEDDQGEDTFFRLSEGLDIGLGNVSNEGPNQQNVNVNVTNSGLDYGNSDDLRSFYVASTLEAVVNFVLETVVKVMGYLL
ncbi:Hypothetical predicted protein [Olea europaea subsp. europaea]|uniref:Uncharacterized protein n=1 Tax=Olea europaea subsp. europaea TaxID=158383 RepID=A0A8S0STK4_OLEEU|nr:Hypothetical predicted protein [Olea europaea subsp. europaea]